MVAVVVVKVYLPTAIERFDIQSRIFILHHALIRLCCLACLMFSTSHTTHLPKYDPHWNGGCMCFGARKIIESVSVCVCVCAAAVIFRVATFILNSLTCIQKQVIWRMVNSLEISISSSGEYEFVCVCVCANILVEHSSSVRSCEYCQS